MNVLITTGIFPPDIGGPATYVPQIARGLAERGHRITVLTLARESVESIESVESGQGNRAGLLSLSDRVHGTPRPRRGRGKGEGDLPDSGYPFRLVRIPRRLFKPWRWIWTIFTIVWLGRRADVLFVNGLAMESVLANFFLRKPMVQKVVGDLAWERATSKGWTTDDFESFQSKGHTPYAIRYTLQINALKSARSWWTRRADKVIVPSRYLARWVQGWGVPEDRITVIYNAVEPVNGIRPAVVPLKTPLKLVTLGRLVSWKRVDQIIEAITKLDEAGLVIIGDGPERSRLEEHAFRVATADRVSFAGQRNNAEAMALMAACDIFVLNSTYEGFPFVVLEAMSLGLPVVGTAVGGTPELVQDGLNGRLISRLDEGALQESLAEVVGSPSLRERLGKGAVITADRFAFKRMLDETEVLLTSPVMGGQ